MQFLYDVVKTNKYKFLTGNICFKYISITLCLLNIIY